MINSHSSKPPEPAGHQSPEFASSYSNLEPSKVDDAYWLYAVRQKGTYPEPTSRNGKWLVFVHRNKVDAVWQRIKKATEDGLLGDCSKVSTTRPNPNSTDPNRHVICVYTYDYKDGQDVRRVRKESRKLGLVAKMPYKTDEDTLRGRYEATDHKRISKYYE